MDKLILYTFLSFVFLVISGQAKAQDLYIINDPDGYINLRTGPGIHHDTYEKIASKSVVIQDTSQRVENGWIPICFHTSRGYIFQDRLKPITDKTIISKINKYTVYDYDGYNPIYAVSLDIPELYAVSDWGCGVTIYDLKRDEEILATGDFTRFNILPNDTLFFICTYGDQWNGTTILQTGKFLPMFAIYKIYKKKDGHFDFYTEIFPEPRKVSPEKAEAILIKAKENTDKFFGSYEERCQQLFTAYCSGAEKAMDILRDFPCDISFSHEQEIYLKMMTAYQRSKKKPD